MGTFEGFRTELAEPGVLTVTFDRPETLNASTIAMKRDLVELLTQAQMDDAVRVLVFTGTGRAFWAGDDMKGYEATAGGAVPAIGGGHRNPIGTYDGLRASSPMYLDRVNGVLERRIERPANSRSMTWSKRAINAR